MADFRSVAPSPFHSLTIIVCVSRLVTHHLHCRVSGRYDHDLLWELLKLANLSIKSCKRSNSPLGSHNSLITDDLLLTGAGVSVSWGKHGSTMLNPANGDPSHVVVNYVEEYLDLVESLPFDLQRSVSLMKEIDAKYQGKKITQLHSAYVDALDTNLKKNNVDIKGAQCSFAAEHLCTREHFQLLIC